MLHDSRQMGTTEMDVARFMMEGYPSGLLKEEQLNEVAMELVGAIKSFMTSHKVAEFITFLSKWVLKITGLGSEKKCDEVSCAEAAIEKVNSKLHSIHHWMEDKVTYFAAMIKFKVLKPSDEQKAESKELSKWIMIAIISTFLIMYISSFGLAVASGSIAKAAWPLIGTISKAADLVQIKKDAESKVESSH